MRQVHLTVYGPTLCFCPSDINSTYSLMARPYASVPMRSTAYSLRASTCASVPMRSAAYSLRLALRMRQVHLTVYGPTLCFCPSDINSTYSLMASVPMRSTAYSLRASTCASVPMRSAAYSLRLALRMRQVHLTVYGPTLCFCSYEKCTLQ